jgi:Arc/MetJ-type ribon-helix-helix transcriptional regulator
MKKTRTTVHLEDKDKEAIAAIRAYYGLSSNDDAIRLALRELLRTIKKKEGGIPPHT